MRAHRQIGFSDVRVPRRIRRKADFGKATNA
jgi:hypothetical protein